MAESYDVIVVGAGPNGLSAAITLAEAGLSVVVHEAMATPGGGARSCELTLPGFVHDICSAVYPLGIASPFFSRLPLAKYGFEWIQPPIPLAHPLDDGTAVTQFRSVDETASQLGEDERAYRTLMRPFVDGWAALHHNITYPGLLVQAPFESAHFGLMAIQPASWFARHKFKGVRARALFAGQAAHSMLSLDQLGSAAFGLVLGISAHAVGWPIIRGGAQRLTDALIAHLQTLGGAVITNSPVRNIAELPRARAVLLDVTPWQLERICGDRLSGSYRRSLETYRYGPGVFKVDWALDSPIPWRAEICRQAGTVHLGATLEEVEASEAAAWTGKKADRPFVLLAQPSLFDATRAPSGRHTAWAYCHVPNGSTDSMLDQIEDQVERFAPGFRNRVLARSAMSAMDMEKHNPNLVGGDIGGGAQVVTQLFLRPNRYLHRTSSERIYLCSSSTPPGASVHGMCGYLAAQSALKRGVARLPIGAF